MENVILNITYPLEGAVLRRLSVVFFTAPQQQKLGRLYVYVKSNDGLWHQQRPPVKRRRSEEWRAICITGADAPRSGWNYTLVALASPRALPPQMAEIPDNVMQSYPVHVTRR